MAMGQTVYADVLFLINFSMDFLVFFICARLSGRRLHVFRVALAAGLGGIYGICALFMPEGSAVSLLCDVAVMISICAVSFYSGAEGLRSFLGRCALFAGVSAILGGIMSAMYALLNRSGLSSLEPGDGDDLSIWLFAILAAAGGAAAFVGGKRARSIAVSRQSEVVITFGGKSVQLRAMTDTGNMLSDPLGGRAVAICELDAVAQIFPRELVEFWQSGEVSAASRLTHEHAVRLRFVPAKGALAAKTALLCAITPDSFSVLINGKRRDADLLLAPVPYKLSAGESRVLLPPGITE
jgi:stage II sporulation protein GA (sporulation sigma-E factor processing peptidase)